MALIPRYVGDGDIIGYYDDVTGQEVSIDEYNALQSGPQPDPGAGYHAIRDAWWKSVEDAWKSAPSQYGPHHRFNLVLTSVPGATERDGPLTILRHLSELGLMSEAEAQEIVNSDQGLRKLAENEAADQRHQEQRGQLAMATILGGMGAGAAFGAPAAAGEGALIGTGGDAVLTGAGAGDTLATMPAAVPESASTLSGWGLTETAPGVWEAAGAAAGAAPVVIPTSGGVPGPDGGGEGLPTPGIGTVPEWLRTIFGSGGEGGGIPPWLGELLGAGVGVVGADQMSDTLWDIYNQSRADRLPFLTQATNWFNDPNAYLAGPGRSAMDSTLRALSVNGNPIGNPTSLALANEAGLRDWRNAVTGFANIGLSGEDSRNQVASNAAGADANVFNAIGAGIYGATNPRRSFMDIYNSLY